MLVDSDTIRLVLVLQTYRRVNNRLPRERSASQWILYQGTAFVVLTETNSSLARRTEVRCLLLDDNHIDLSTFNGYDFGKGEKVIAMALREILFFYLF